jgi:hypothetical protein
MSTERDELVKLLYTSDGWTEESIRDVMWLEVESDYRRNADAILAAGYRNTSSLCDLVRQDFDRELATEGATRDSTMAVRGWLKRHGLWSGPDINGATR